MIVLGVRAALAPFCKYGNHRANEPEEKGRHEASRAIEDAGATCLAGGVRRAVGGPASRPFVPQCVHDLGMSKNHPVINAFPSAVEPSREVESAFGSSSAGVNVTLQTPNGPRVAIRASTTRQPLEP